MQKFEITVLSEVEAYIILIHRGLTNLETGRRYAIFYEHNISYTSFYI